MSNSPSPQYAEAVAAERAALKAAVPAAAEAAIAWAAAAGVATAAAQGVIEDVLRSHEVFVEDSFIALIDALGLPPAIAPAREGEALSGRRQDGVRILALRSRR